MGIMRKLFRQSLQRQPRQGERDSSENNNKTSAERGEFLALYENHPVYQAQRAKLQESFTGKKERIAKQFRDYQREKITKDQATLDKLIKSKKTWEGEAIAENNDFKIISNWASFDVIQYQENPASAGMSMIHLLAYPKMHIMNGVDLTVDTVDIIGEMIELFEHAWEDEKVREKVLRHQLEAIERRTKKLKEVLQPEDPDKYDFDIEAAHKIALAHYQELKSKVETGKLNSRDFTYNLHLRPDNSADYLHLHILASPKEYRKYSTSAHDWKSKDASEVCEFVREEDEKARIPPATERVTAMISAKYLGPIFDRSDLARRAHEVPFSMSPDDELIGKSADFLTSDIYSLKDWPRHIGEEQASRRATNRSIDMPSLPHNAILRIVDSGTSQVFSSLDMGTNQTCQPIVDMETPKYDFSGVSSNYTPDIPELSCFMQGLAKELFDNSKPPDSASLGRILGVLPELLGAFALKLGREQENMDYFGTMKLIHKNRDKITEYFETYYLRDANVLNNRDQSLDSAPDEKVCEWDSEMRMDDTQVFDTMPHHALANNDHSPSKYQEQVDDGMGKTAESNNRGDETDDGLQFSNYRHIVTTSAAFPWLQDRLSQEIYLTTSEASAMQRITKSVRQLLYSRQENCIVSGLRGPPICSMQFSSTWQPPCLILGQDLDAQLEATLAHKIVFVQDTQGNTEAMPCWEYVSRTWPAFGNESLQLVQRVLNSETRSKCSVILCDKTELTGWLEQSGFFLFEATGVVESIVEIGEILGFMTTALSSASSESVVLVQPFLNINIGAQDELFKASIFVKDRPYNRQFPNDCWMDLVRNVVVVEGYPVRRHSQAQEPGLEASLATLTRLSEERPVTGTL